MDKLIPGQDEAKQALLLAANCRHGPRQHVLLIGGSSSTRLFLARAVAHVLGVPFAVGDAKNLAAHEPETQPILMLLYDLLR
ncbi:MAG TPA: hypothetical protein VFA18_07650, partial [Gemmataceae bacterium]|nr:hypothetical protein [Gemmataceae bacterium]